VLWGTSLASVKKHESTARAESLRGLSKYRDVAGSCNALGRYVNLAAAEKYSRSYRIEREKTVSRWSRKFDHPIVLDDKTLLTLRDAANHILALPERQFAREHWQTALRELSISAECGGSGKLARIAVVTALNTDGQYRRKPATRHRIR
jgi:hypothetical protein